MTGGGQGSSDAKELYEFISITHPMNAVAVVTLNRESKRNALSNQLLSELSSAIGLLEANDKVRCVVITGSTTCFSSGADINEMRKDGLEAITNDRRMKAWKALEATSLPIIAAVSGICFGGGHELAMLCDIVIASENARFGQPEIKLGHIPGDGATQRLIRLVGKYQAMRMILTGEPILAEEALALGLVAEVIGTESCLDRAVELAGQIARHSPMALSLAKNAVQAAQQMPLEEGLELERRNIARAFTTSDQKEGMAAFFEKRSPKFVGR